MQNKQVVIFWLRGHNRMNKEQNELVDDMAKEFGTNEELSVIYGREYEVSDLYAAINKAVMQHVVNSGTIKPPQ